ncbi:MAG: hypothetical protein QOI57_1137 [Rubrobacteraceae bacterium]|jgi:hypothetical protein|nr:hypothetical protein [Rubrobacteraceae bacterium]
MGNRFVKVFDANFRSDFWVFMHLLLEDRTAEQSVPSHADPGVASYQRRVFATLKYDDRTLVRVRTKRDVDPNFGLDHTLTQQL